MQHHYIIELLVNHHSGKVDRHTVAYMAEQPWEWKGQSGVGTIIDNGTDPVKGVTDGDRGSVGRARDVFDRLFDAASVRVDGVWRIVRA